MYTGFALPRLFLSSDASEMHITITASVAYRSLLATPLLLIFLPLAGGIIVIVMALLIALNRYFGVTWKTQHWAITGWNKTLYVDRIGNKYTESTPVVGEVPVQVSVRPFPNQYYIIAGVCSLVIAFVLIIPLFADP